MHGPDGTDYQNKIIYEEVLRPERLVYSHVVGPRFRMTVTLQELDRGEKTGLTANMVFESNEDYKSCSGEVPRRRRFNSDTLATGDSTREYRTTYVLKSVDRK